MGSALDGRVGYAGGVSGRPHPGQRPSTRPPASGSQSKLPAVEGGRPSRPPPPQSEDEIRGRLERLAALGGRAAEVAHELRNALSVLETSLHLARRALKAAPEVTSKAEPHLARMAEQIHAGQAIVREVLEESRDSVELAPVDLRSLVLEVIGGVTRPEHLSLDADVARVRVVIDARQVRQLLINLVRNAVEALSPSRSTPRPGKIRIQGSLANQGTELLLFVEDDGPGIDAAVAPRLFQAFATGKRGGTGLGLALCRRIAEAHGGAIVAEPITPRGTRMKVTLPLPVPAKPPSESRRMAIR